MRESRVEAAVRYMAIGLIVLVLAGFAFVVLVAYAVAYGDAEPTWISQDETRVYGCYMQEEPGDETLTITFREAGRVARIASRGETATVMFTGGGLAGDYYRGGEVTLTIDPEAYVDGLRTGSRGPCQWQ